MAIDRKKLMRTNYVSDFKFQTTISMLGVSLSLFTAALFYMPWRYVKVALQEAECDFSQSSIDISLLINDNSTQVLIIFSAILVLSFIGHFMVLHKVSGPIVKLKRHMRDTLDGKDVPEIYFRKDDYFSEIADLYNEILKKQSKK